MKIISMLLVAVFCFTSLVFAETNTEAVSTIDLGDLVNKIPVEEIREGIVYSYDDKKIKPLTSYGVIKGPFGVEDLSFNIGWITEDNELTFDVSYSLVNLRKDWGVKMWILDKAELSITTGWGLKEVGKDNEGDPLFGSGSIKWKF